MVKTLVERTAEYVKQQLKHEASGHDWFHVERVWRVAKRLQREEGGDLELIELAALLHNLGDHNYQFRQFNETKESLALHGIMDSLDIAEERKEQIIKIVNEIKFGGIETKPPVTIEGKVVQDANFLDALGAIGIARCFASGGYHERAIYDPEIKARKHLTRTVYQRQKQRGTSLNNFSEKALVMAGLLNTSAAKKMVEPRAQFIRDFIVQFKKEWEEGNG